jgi:hypothetical protein
MLEIIKEPWPWYVAGPLIGLTVPVLLIIGNKSFGISSSLRHICAACIPANISFFKYDWKKESWNLFFVLGIFLGGMIAAYFLANPNPVEITPQLSEQLASYGITDHSGLLPKELIFLGKFIHASWFYHDCGWRIFSWFRNALRRRMHERTCDYGNFKFTMAFISSDNLFYDWRFYYGQFDFALYSFTLKFQK